MGLEILQEVIALASGRYPGFIYGLRPGPWSASYLPIFAFHSLEPCEFERKLRYLVDNSYRSVSLDAALAWMRDGKSLPDRAVVLTIDDGRLSTWSVGYPLLRKYGLQATAFIIIDYVEEGPSRPTIDDLASGSEEWSTTVLPERTDQQTVLRWSELDELHASGVIAIESHTTLHKQVVVSPKITGFVTPDFAAPWYEIPLSAASRTGWTGARRNTALGTPLYAAAPILTRLRGYEAAVLDDHPCSALVRDAGGPAFFERADWREVLEAEARAGDGLGEKIDLRPHQEWELRRSKEILEERLPDKRVRHLCYPHGVGSERAGEIARDAGYASCLWGFRPAGKSNRAGCDPYVIGRIKHDWIERLPGQGRVSLSRIARRKVRRRAGGETGF